jgi:hypothetical protein
MWRKELGELQKNWKTKVEYEPLPSNTGMVSKILMMRNGWKRKEGQLGGGILQHRRNGLKELSSVYKNLQLMLEMIWGGAGPALYIEGKRNPRHPVQLGDTQCKKLISRNTILGLTEKVALSNSRKDVITSRMNL